MLPPNQNARDGQALLLVQLGLGGVGRALLAQYLYAADRYPAVRYAAVADRSGICWVRETWTNVQLIGLLEAKSNMRTLEDFAPSLGDSLLAFVPSGGDGLPPVDLGLHQQQAGAEGEYAVVDVTAERGSYSTLLAVREQGAHLVMCNKWTLAEPFERYKALLSAGSGKIRYETTVGAALPVIRPLGDLLKSGDEVTQIDAAISGTLGYVCTRVQDGTPFSEALGEASRLGYTEPDPRDDLAGVDARRKALILARMLGLQINMSDVEVESLVPGGLEDVSIDEFWVRLPEHDDAFNERRESAAREGRVLRFLAEIRQDGARVALQETPLQSAAGTLSGTESLFVIHTARYGEQPLTVRGRGAGADVTAAGVLADILSLVD